jgi:hypothetical protein
LEESAQASSALDQAVLERLSPLQQKILLELAAGPTTLDKLSKKTGSSIFTIGKQLSLLQMRTKYNPLHKKGIKSALVQKDKDRPGMRTTYFIASQLSSNR